jgi:hypothetical protein
MSVYSSTPDSTTSNAAAITPSNTVNLPSVTKALYVGGSGNISVFMEYDTTTPVVFNNAQAGSVLPIRVVRVLATNTTATGLVGLF